MAKKKKIKSKKTIKKIKFKRLALISVSDKKGVVPFVKGLKKVGFEIVSTGGTAKVLKKAKLIKLTGGFQVGVHGNKYEALKKDSQSI